MDDHFQRNDPKKYSKTWKSRAKAKQYSIVNGKVKQNLKGTVPNV
jgi:hypothetical protein